MNTQQNIKRGSLKILHVIRTVNAHGGGPIEGLKQLARENIGNGHVVHVACLDKSNDPWVTECPVKCFALGPAAMNYGYCPALIPWLKARHEEYDAVIVNGIWQYHSYAVRKALAGTKTPYFVYTHGMLDPYFKRRYPFKHLKKWMYWPWGEYLVLRDAEAVLFTCEEERRLASGSFWLYKVRELVVNYGVAEPPYSEGQRAGFLEAFPELAGKRILLSLGRVNPKKGLELTIRAFGEVCKSGNSHDDSLHLVIAGPENKVYGAQLRSIVAELAIESQVSFVGMLIDDMKWGAFRSADAFILNSYQENFGIAVVEAKACGLPVFISDQVNIWREIESDDAGVVEPASLSGARAHMQAWLNFTAERRSKMARAAQSSFRTRFNAETAAYSLISAIRKRSPNLE